MRIRYGNNILGTYSYVWNRNRGRETKNPNDFFSYSSSFSFFTHSAKYMSSRITWKLVCEKNIHVLTFIRINLLFNHLINFFNLSLKMRLSACQFLWYFFMFLCRWYCEKQMVNVRVQTNKGQTSRSYTWEFIQCKKKSFSVIFCYSLWSPLTLLTLIKVR